jgi:hypothetical protein
LRRGEQQPKQPTTEETVKRFETSDIETTRDSPSLVDLKDFIARVFASVDASNNKKKATP